MELIMSFITSLFGRKKTQLADLQLDITGWELHHRHNTSVAWYTEEKNAVRIQLHAPVIWPFAMNDIAAATQYWQQETAKIDGALLTLQSLEIQGVPALQGIFKYRNPTPGSLGMYYVAIIWIPVNQGLFQLNVEAVEQGDTGIREALVFNMQLQQGEVLQDEPELIVSAEELFAKMRESTLRCLPSDDSQYDEMFPDHPLSQVRRTVALCAQQLRLARHLRS